MSAVQISLFYLNKQAISERTSALGITSATRFLTLDKSRLLKGKINFDIIWRLRFIVKYNGARGHTADNIYFKMINKSIL